MTAITQKQLDRIKIAIDNLMLNFPARAPMSNDRFRDLFYTPEEKAIVDAAHKLISADEDRFRGYRLETRVSKDELARIPLPENLFCQPDESIRFTINAAFIGFLPPSEKLKYRAGIPNEVTQEFKSAARDVVEKAAIRGFFRKIKDIYGKAASHEAMRYEFPGTVYILREAGLEEIADKVETVRRVPNIRVPLSRWQREMFKFVNSWFATQMLLDTFKQKPLPGIDPNYTTLSLASSHYISIPEDRWHENGEVGFMFE